MKGSAITSPQLMARIAGCLYLFIIIGALFAPFAGAPSGMMRENAALPNAARILASPSAYFLGGVVQLLVFACDIAVALLFYELLKPANRSLAPLAKILRLAFAQRAKKT